jgi:hypothetical protein
VPERPSDGSNDVDVRPYPPPPPIQPDTSKNGILRQPRIPGVATSYNPSYSNK